MEAGGRGGGGGCCDNGEGESVEESGDFGRSLRRHTTVHARGGPARTAGEFVEELPHRAELWYARRFLSSTRSRSVGVSGMPGFLACERLDSRVGTAHVRTRGSRAGRLQAFLRYHVRVSDWTRIGPRFSGLHTDSRNQNLKEACAPFFCCTKPLPIF